MRTILRQALIVAAGLAMASCGGCDSDKSGGENSGSGANNMLDEDNNFVAPDGAVCADATPCGDCDHDCRPIGNPFAGGGDSGGNNSTAGGGGTGYDGETCTLNSDCRGLCGGSGLCEGFGGGGYNGDSCLSVDDCRGECGGDGLCTGSGTAGGGDPTGGTGGNNGTTTPNNSSGGGGGTGGGPDQNTCLDLEVNLEHAIPTVALLIDQSGSMTEGFGGGLDRWEAAFTSLMDPNDGLIMEMQGAFRIGLSLYTSDGGGPDCPLLADVRPELNNFEPINRVFSQAEPESDTPTGESILGTLRQFDIHQDQGRKILLLATDGEPDTCAVPNPQEGQPESVSAAQAAFQQGVETIVLSVGDDVGAPHLEDMANAGVGLPIGGAQQAPYYTANDPDQLKNEMRTIINSARSCIFRVQGGVVDPGILDQANVTVDGLVIQFGDANGWTYHQNRATCQGAKQCIELQGNACTTIQDGQPHDILGEFPCVYYDPENPPIGGGGGSTIPNNSSGGGGTGGNNTSGGGGGSGGPKPCVAANGGCEFDGDCCSGICSAQTGGICIVN